MDYHSLQPSYFELNKHKWFPNICWHSFLTTILLLVAIVIVIFNFGAITKMGVYNQLVIVLLASLVILLHGISKYIYKYKHI